MGQVHAANSSMVSCGAKVRKLYIQFYDTCLVVLAVRNNLLELMKSEQNTEDDHSTNKSKATCLLSDTAHYPVSWCQPLYKPWDQYGSFEMVFVDVPCLTSLIRIGHEKRWHIIRERLSSVNDEEIKSLFSDDVFTIAFTASLTLLHPLFKAQLCKSNVLMGAVPHVYNLTRDKWETYLLLQKFLKPYGMSVEQLYLMPKTYLMSELMQSPSDLQYLKDTKPNSMWLIKPRRNFGGHGIEVINSTLQLEQKLELSDRRIVQEYIHNLLLLEGCKFDIRAFILIANTQPYMLFHHDGYLRVSLKVYDPKGSRDAHLSNTHIQIENPDFSPEKHYWFYDRLQTYLDQHHPDNNNFVTNKLTPFIKKTAILLLHSGIILSLFV